MVEANLGKPAPEEGIMGMGMSAEVEPKVEKGQFESPETFAGAKKLSPIAERLQRALEEDTQFKEHIEDMLTKHLPAIRALEETFPDLEPDFRALWELVEGSPLEIAKRLLYKISQEAYTRYVKEHYGKKISPLFMSQKCHRQCSEWTGKLLLNYGPEEARTMVATKCVLKEYDLPDDELNLLVETAVHLYPELFKEILGVEGKEFTPKAGRVVERFLKYGVYSLRKYFAEHLSEWKEVLHSSQSGTSQESNLKREGVGA